MNKKLLGFVICLILLSLFLFSIGTVIAQSQPATEKTERVLGGSSIKSFWQLTEHAGLFRWPLFLTFIIGIILIVKQFIDLFFDRKNAKPIYNINFKRFKRIDQIENSMRQYKSMASDLICSLIQTLNAAPAANQFTEELEKFSSMQKQHFSTFQARMAFWSDTAGALGLLGTVWGMFVTFFKGDMDQQAILSGMGIALITTLMGLVISVILNFFTTEVSGFFNRSLTQFPRVAEKLRAWVFITQPIQPVVSMDKPVPEIIQPEEQILAVETESTEQDEIKYELIEISGNNQKSLVKQQIKSPLVVECNQIQDGKKKKAVGEEILFTVVSGQGSFENGHTEIVTKTNTAGRAKVYFTPEEPNGSNQIEVRHAKLTGKPILFKVEVIALKPADIRIKDGNNQSGPSGKKLVNPLVVEVVDDDLNPVYGCFINMQVEMGDGFFNNNETTIQVSTDDKGLAAAEFILGKDGGFNSVKAEITELPGKYLSFQALGQ